MTSMKATAVTKAQKPLKLIIHISSDSDHSDFHLAQDKWGTTIAL